MMLANGDQGGEGTALDPQLARSILETAPMIVLVLDVEGRIEWVNAHFEQLTGRRLEDIRGLEWVPAFLPVEDHQRIQALFRETLGEPVTGNVNPIVTVGGALREIEWHARALHESDGSLRGVACIGKDVTEQLAAELSRRTSEARLREAQRLANIGSWELDFTTGDLAWSDGIYRIFELDQERFEPSYESFLGAIHPEDRALVDEAYQKSVEERTPYEIDHRLRMADGRVKYVCERGNTHYDEQGKPTRSVGTLQDISSQVRSEKRLRSILDGMFAFVGLYDLDGILLEVNRAPLEAANLRREDVIGRPFWETYWWSYSPEAQEQIRSDMRRAANGETVRRDHQVRVGEDQFITLDTMIGPLRDDAGHIRSLIGSGVDVTDRKRAEMQVAAELTDKEVLLREVHHRVKNNLQIVASLLYLQQRGTDDTRITTVLRESRARVDAMGLIHEKLYEGSFTQICLADYTRNLVSALLETYGTRRERVRVEVVGGGIDTTLDQAVPYGLILNELISNSLKHAFPDDREGSISIRFDVSDEEVVMLVSDDGIGMPSDPHRSISSSLGLRLVARLAAQLGGEITRNGPPGTTHRLVVRRD